jgi:hypothetical protein
MIKIWGNKKKLKNNVEWRNLKENDKKRFQFLLTFQIACIK